MTAQIRFRDIIRRFVPPWLSDRGSLRGPNGIGSYGYAFIWSMVAPIDKAVELLTQGTQAPYPGLGTPTALPLIGRTRGVTRSQDDTDETYAARLVTWLDDARLLGTAEGIAKSVHDFMSSHPMVRVVTRSGRWVTCHTDGTFSYNPTLDGDDAPAWDWDWDSVSHPTRSGNWSELWVIIYTTQWAVRANTYGDGIKYGDDLLGRGHAVTREEYDQVKAELARHKAAHTRIRTVIWSYDDTQFDPTTTSTLKPDGTWGGWGYGDPRVRARDASCRYWEP